MSTSLFYHTMGIRGYRYVSTKYENSVINVTITQDRRTCRCPGCGSANIILKGGEWRRFRGIPIGRRPVWIHFRVPRVQCRNCGTLRQVALGFAEPRRTYIKAFERYVLELADRMTIQDVAEHLGISWDVVKEIVKANLQRNFAKPRLKDLRQIAIDEISIGAGHRYLTIVLDLASGAVVHVGRGKGGDSLTDFWKRLRSSGAKIEAVGMDMSPAFIQAVMTNLPQAKIIFDRFHVMKLLNDKLSDLRRAMYRDIKDNLGREVLKGSRWLLLKRPANLDPKRKEKERLEEALRLNAPLAMAYYLKEELYEFWEQEDYYEAERFLLQWIESAEATRIRQLVKFAQTLRAHHSGLLNYYDYPISSGPLEGTNNKIKTMKRQAYGYRDQEFFQLKIYALHKARYALVG
jgi:transposase